jgi:hypothetical protein
MNRRSAARSDVMSEMEKYSRSLEKIATIAPAENHASF